MPSSTKLDIKLRLSRGVLDVRCLEFLEFLAAVPTELDREHSEICVEEEGCSIPPSHGESGAEKLT